MASESLDLATRRTDFPSLQRQYNGLPIAFFDGPAGTQVPRRVIDAVAGYYASSNANTHGAFATSRETDQAIEEARCAVAGFLGAPSPDAISFGANMTSLAYSLSHALARTFRPGDEVLITQLDHEANRGPWLLLRERGVVVREVRIRPEATLDEEDLRAKLTERTRLLAMGMASNAFGTVNNVALARKLTREVGALLLVDAVHFAPHFAIDVAALGVDFLLCSAYKFYGPHVGILYAREGLLELLQTDRLRTQDARAPHRIETGTLNHAAIVGVRAAIDYIASLGTGATLRTQLSSAMEAIGRHERSIGAALHAELGAIKGVMLWGPPYGDAPRAPTLAFTLAERLAGEVAAALAERAICTWDGHFYAIRPVELLGLLERGGVVRVGVSLYTSREEAERLVQEVRRIAEVP
jgi:cysteine desulfurase family protein (TIGR01976 family)